MDFRVLGPLEVSRDGRDVPINSRMQRRLLALLLIHAGAFISAERIIDALWQGQPPPSAAGGLHAYVSRLRNVLADGAQVESGSQGYRLRVDGHAVDARSFERGVAVARERLDHDPADAAEGLGEALGLWRGPAYAEFADEPFARPEAVRLDELRLAATEDAFAARLAIDDGRLVSDLEAFTAAHPLRERAHAQLMTALAKTGRQTEALEVFQRVRSRSTEELGLDPSPALRQLQTDILQQAPSVTPPVSEPVSSTGPAGTRGNLPRPVTSFVGRRHETEAVVRLLERSHLVTLTGVGGVGKTRLAMQASAAVAEQFPDGAWWCELAPADPGSVGHTVAAALDVQQQIRGTIAESIVGALDGKQLLLVLDNCEHVVEASAQLVERILLSCPEVTVLATSREPLAVEGEHVWLVPPLRLPSEHPGAGVDGDAASTLFCDRARAHRADFTADQATLTAVADVCRQLDGLPLAIELAAALVPALEPAEIARRLGQRFRLLTRGRRTDPRHRSLAAVVEWSYQLLDADEQRLFDRLAVFAGGFTLTAVEGVCIDEDLPQERVAGLLAGLVSRSMVGVDRTTTPVRYHLLETLRQYAGERLADSGDAPALRARHAAWFVDLAERADTDVRGPREAEGVALLEVELGNLRAAHRWALERDDADLALRLSSALYAFARFRLRDEVFEWAEEAAALASASGHRLQPTVWGVAAHGISSRGDLAHARQLAERALAAAPDADDPARFPALHVLGSAALYEGRLADCRRYMREAVASARRGRDTYHVNWIRMHEVLSLVYGQDRGAALEAALAQRAAADELGNPNQRAWALYGHAEACGDADPEQALALLEEALALAEPVHGRYLEGVARVAMASLRARHQSPRHALASFPEIISHWRRVGDWIHQWTTLRNLVPLLVRVDADRPGALLYGATRTAGTAAPAYGAEAARLERAREALTARLGPTELQRLVEEGQALSGSEAVDLALAAINDALELESPPTGHAR